MQENTSQCRVNMKMRRFVIELTDTDVRVNGKLHTFGCKMDKNDCETDMGMKAVLALVDEMGFEPSILFGEIEGRLYEMLDEGGLQI